MGRLKRKKTSGPKKTTAPATEKVTAPETAKPADASQKSPDKGVDVKKIISLKKTSKPVKASSVKQKPNFIDKSLQFIREVRVELKKVTWPSRKQTVGSTVVVLILVMIISLFLGVVDMGLSGLIRVVLN